MTESKDWRIDPISLIKNIENNSILKLQELEKIIVSLVFQFNTFPTEAHFVSRMQCHLAEK